MRAWAPEILRQDMPGPLGGRGFILEGWGPRRRHPAVAAGAGQVRCLWSSCL